MIHGIHNKVHSQSRGRSAFSLIEMMTALAIVSVGVVAVIRSLSSSMEANRRVGDRAVAIDLLKITTAQFSAVSEEMEVKTDSFDPPYQDYEWLAEVTPTDLPGLYRLEVEISWPGRSIRRHLRIATLVPQRL